MSISRRVITKVSIFILSCMTGVACRPDGLDSAPGIHVGASVQVSAELSTDAHYETQLAADPNQRNNLMVCSILYAKNYSSSEIVTYVSTDGGKTWRLKLRIQGDQRQYAFDPSCSYGPGGAAYSISEVPAIDNFGKRWPSVRIDGSNDAGDSWLEINRVPHGERTYITVDSTDGPLRGTFYLYGQSVTCPYNKQTTPQCKQGLGLLLQHSRDGGHNVYTQSVTIPDGQPWRIGAGAILPDGTLVFPCGAGEESGKLELVRASLVKQAWPLKVEAFDIIGWPVSDKPWKHPNTAENESLIPVLAVDSSSGPFRGRIYVTWPDDSSGHSRIYFAYSSDRGETWSVPRIVDDAPNTWTSQIQGASGQGPDNIHGTVAVNSAGVVGVMWLDRRNHPDNLGFSPRFRASLDGGETFLPSVAVSDVDYDPQKTEPMPIYASVFTPTTATMNLGPGKFVFTSGDTVGFAADAAGAFHPLWVGNPAGVPQLWTSTITVDGKAKKNGSSELEALTDVTKRIGLRFSNRAYHRQSNSLDLDLQLENTSTDPITGPIFVRLIELGSGLATASVETADSGPRGEGAVWEFGSLVDRATLEPGGLTRPKHLRFKLAGFDRYRLLGGLPSLVEFKVKVFAGPPVSH